MAVANVDVDVEYVVVVFCVVTGAEGVFLLLLLAYCIAAVVHCHFVVLLYALLSMGSKLRNIFIA